MVNSKWYKKTFLERCFDFILYAIMFFILIITLYPFWSQIVISLSSGHVSGISLFPKDITFESYQLAFEYKALWTGYKNTIIRTVLGVGLSITFTALTAYPISKTDLPFNRVITGMILFTMVFGGGLIPNYLLIKNLGLLNSMWALVIPGMMGAFNILIMRNFFRSIPESLEESARVDGAGYFTIFWKIIIPLSKPVLATISLFVMVGHWNAWFDSMIYIADPAKQVLQVVLRKIIIEGNLTDINSVINQINQTTEFTGPQLQATVIMFSVLPMLIVYPFVQRHFVKGIMLGAVK